MATAPFQTGARTTPFTKPVSAPVSGAPRPAGASPERRRVVSVIAGTAILLLAALRTWDARHDVSPDGISYLDLSDAVVQGRWSGLVSTYWSPLYPLIIGLSRLALAWTPLAAPANEIVVVHIVNLALFAISFVAFGWLVVELSVTAAAWGHRGLSTAGGRVAAYVLFAALTLAMSPPSLTTPDLLVNTACFAAFASILRLERERSLPNAILLGASLGLGVLAKSFMLPFTALVLGVVALRQGRRGARAVAMATAVWLVVTAPWVAAVSHAAGHFTAGQTGRLNYIWFVNGQQPPNGGELPVSTLAAVAQQIVPGLGLMPEVNGTNPLWLDPARWYPDLHARWDARRQIAVLGHGLRYYLTLFAPLLLACAVLIALADLARLRRAAVRVWPILLPCVAALLAYALVYTVARYLVAFVAAGALVSVVALEWAPPARGAAVRATLAVVLLLICEWGWGATRHFLVLPLAMAAALPTYVALLPRRRVLSVVAAFAVGILVAAVADQWPASWYPLLIAAIGVATWSAMRNTTAVVGAAETARAVRAAAIVAALCGLVIRVGRDTKGAMAAMYAARGSEENPSWTTARDLVRLGVTPGSRIAVVASPYDAAWARLGRLHLVGAVPPSRAGSYWRLDDAGRLLTTKLFAAAGATAIVAVPAPAVLPPGWLPVSGGAVLRIGAPTKAADSR